MRCAIAAILVVCLGLGVYGCTEAQKKAAEAGASDGSSGAPVAPPSGLDNFFIYMAAYLAGTTAKEGVRAAKNKWLKA